MNKAVGWIFLAGAAGGLYWWQPGFFQMAYHLIQQGDIAALAEYLRSFGMGAVTIILLLFILMTFTVVFPFMILSGAAGIMYGLFWGTLLSWMGEVLGAVCMFVFARYFFRTLVSGWIYKSRYLQQVDAYSAGKKGFRALLVARLLPLAPSGIITAVAAVSRMNFRDFFLATFLGKLPPVVIKVILGHDLAFAEANTGRLVLLGTFVIGLYIFLWLRKRKRASVMDTDV